MVLVCAKLYNEEKVGVGPWMVSLPETPSASLSPALIASPFFSKLQLEGTDLFSENRQLLILLGKEFLFVT
jgi:hypothetical protein